MDRLISAIISEVCLAYGIEVDTPIPKTLLVNIEGRIKTYLAFKLGICQPETIVNTMKPHMDSARIHDQAKGLIGKWYDKYLV